MPDVEFGLSEIPGAPSWVVAWESARVVGDRRNVAEQIPAMAESAMDIPAAPFSDGEVWIQPGEYGYEACRYDFGAPVEQNRLCVWHPDTDSNQPLERVLIGGRAFMCCLDCAAKVRRHDAEEPGLRASVLLAKAYIARRLRRLVPRKLRPRYPQAVPAPVDDDPDDDDGIPF